MKRRRRLPTTRASRSSRSWSASLRSLGHDVVDLGTHSTEPVDYPDYAEAVARAVLGGTRGARRAHLRQRRRGLGGRQQVPGIRAGLCHDSYSAHQGVEHDDMNVLVLGARVIGVELARELVRVFLDARFTHEQRHERRLGKITALEEAVRHAT